MRNVIIHYHIFKNAGTSMDRILAKNFGSAWSTFEGATPTSLLQVSDLERFLAEHPDLRAVSSHLARPPLPRGMNVLPIVILRHPLDRAASVYLQERRAPSNVKSSEIAKMRDFRGYLKWCLDECEGRAEGGVVIRNYQVVHLSAASFRQNHIYQANAQPEDLEEAVHFLSNIPFFGIVEDFDVSLRLLEKLAQLMWPNFTAVSERENVSPDRPGQLQVRLRQMQQELGEETWQALLRENQLDLQLYSVATARFREKAASMGSVLPGAGQCK